MALKLGDVIPDFMAESTQGPIALHDYIEGRWAILFSHPNDFTPVCTTELASVATLMPQFAERGVKVLALSCNTLLSHLEWIQDIECVAMAQAARRRGSGVMAEKEVSDDDATGSRSSPLLNDSGFSAMEEEKQHGSEASGTTPGPSPLLNSGFPAIEEEKQHGSEALSASGSASGSGSGSGIPPRRRSPLPGASPLLNTSTFPGAMEEEEEKWHGSEASRSPLPGASPLLNTSTFPGPMEEEEKHHGSEPGASPLLSNSRFPGAMEEEEEKHHGSEPAASPLSNTSRFPGAMEEEEEKHHGSKPAASPLSNTSRFPGAMEEEEEEKHHGSEPAASPLSNTSRFPGAMEEEEKQHGSEASGSRLPPPPTVSYPILCDPDRSIAVRLGILDPSELDPRSGSSLAARAVLVLGPDKKLRASVLYPASTGRNFAEILRVLDSLQLTDSHGVATPVDWKRGEPCMVLPGFSDDAARERFVKGFETIPVPSGRGYLRVTPQPDL